MFRIKSKSGTYKVWMRGAYRKSITSQKKFEAAIQRTIDSYRQKSKAWQLAAYKFQELLNEKDFIRIANEWGMFNRTQKENVNAKNQS